MGRGDLAMLIHKVVPVDGACWAGHGTNGTLCPVICVACDAILWSDLRGNHLQAVELGGNLDDKRQFHFGQSLGEHKIE